MKEVERLRCLEALNEVLRRLGPYRQMTNGEPSPTPLDSEVAGGPGFRVNDSQLAHLISEVVLVLHHVLSEMQGTPAPKEPDRGEGMLGGPFRHW